jgi:YD repeat-containing protein
MKKLSIANACLLLCCFWGYSQISTTEYSTPAVIPQSPEVASILRYSEVPVSYYNGIPSVGVPIYTLQGRELSAPINLSYHAGGHRVSEEASWVGLGWSLSAGGQISRTVKGYPDDGGQWGFISNPNTVQYVKDVCDQAISNPPQSCAFLTGQQAIDLRYDYEPDDFNYSMFGQSGRFMFNQERDANNPKGEIIQFPNKNVIITPSYGSNTYTITGWTITDTNGIVYEFAEGNKFHSADTYQKIAGQIAYSEGDGDGVAYIETWNLVKVTSPNGDVITLEYDRPVLDGYTSAYPFNDINTTQGSQSLIVHNSNGPLSDQDKKRIDTYSITKRHYSLLSKITSSRGSVHFIRDTANRLDTQSSKQRLQQIEVYNSDNQLTQRIVLTHGYFNSPYITESEFIGSNTASLPANIDSFLNKRLYLEKVTFQGHYGGYNPADNYSYSFDYNTDTMLPHRRSYAQDHWGYYNGKSNSNLIPYQSTGNTQKANREVDPDYSDACILNSITYPEGGVTKLYFENNRGDVRNIDLPPYLEKKIEVQALAANQHSIVENGNTITYTFWSDDFTVSSNAKPSVSDDTKTQLEYFGFSNRCDTVDALYSGADQVCNSMFFDLYEVSGLAETLVQRFSIWESGSILVDKGKTYKVKIIITANENDYNLVDHYSDVSFSWFEENPNQSAEVFDYFGGLRVKAIKTYDDRKLSTYKSYEYSDGYIISQPFYFSVGTGDVRKYVSQSWVPLLTTQSGYAGYTSVIESIHEVATETGYSTLDGGSSEMRQVRRTYSNASTDIAFPSAPYTQDWVGGNPELEEITGKSSTATSYATFADQNVDNIQGLVLQREYHLFPFDVASHSAVVSCLNAGSCNISRNIYNIWPGQKLPNLQTVITKEGTRELTQVTETFYESAPYHYNPTKTRFTDSKGDVYETVISYPYEENNTTLLSENRLNLPLKTQQYKGTTLMQTAITQFSGFTGTDPTENPTNTLLQSMSAAKASNTLEERITYHGYNKYGQVREVSKTNGTHITYLWGYNYNYPVAKIENATYAQVASIVDEGTIQNLSGTTLENTLDALRSALPEAMVSSYVYDPLIGVTQTTDPRGRSTYYKYDGMGRLTYVLDHDQHVLSSNSYHYKNN